MLLTQQVLKLLRSVLMHSTAEAEFILPTTAVSTFCECIRETNSCASLKMSALQVVPAVAKHLTSSQCLVFSVTCLIQLSQFIKLKWKTLQSVSVKMVKWFSARMKKNLMNNPKHRFVILNSYESNTPKPTAKSKSSQLTYGPLLLNFYFNETVQTYI